MKTTSRMYEGYSDEAVLLLQQANELDYVEAVKVYDNVISRFPEPAYAYAYAKRGYANHKSGAFEQAIDDFNIAIEKNPEAKNTIWQRGISKWNSGLLKEAIEDLEQYSRLKPDDPEAFYWMRKIAEEMDELALSPSYFESALRIDSSYY